LRLVTATEMNAVDRIAIQDFGIPGVVLMENAGLRVVEVITRLLGNPTGKTVVVFAGKGNNGGDGFVVARHLHNRGTKVQVFLDAERDKISGDALINLNIWEKMGQKVFPLHKNINLVRLALVNADLVVDALYGTGFRGSVREHMVPVIEAINASGKPVVAVDVPSGLEADSGKVHGPCVRADYTVTFALPKLGLVLAPGSEYVGKLEVADISIPSAAVANIDSRRFYLTEQLVKEWWPNRPSLAHKGNFGRVLIIAGSRGMSGAAVLAALAAIRSGAGLVTLGVPASIHDIAEAKLTEVMTFPLPETDRGTLSRTALDEVLDRSRNADVLAIGPGLGNNADVAALVKETLLRVEIPCVLDADALNAMSGRTELFRVVKSDLILTPHPGEMSRLTGLSINQVQDNRLETVTKKATEWHAVVVLKGAGTIVAGPDGTLYVNGTGNPGMASGGTGDVLTGVIAGLAAQGLPSLHATAAGVFLHGLAGDAAASEKGMTGMLAGDLLEKLPKIYKRLE